MRLVKLYAFSDEACKMVDGQIAAMKRNGLAGPEVRGVDGQTVSAISIEKAVELRKKLDDNGLSVWSIGSPIGKVKLSDDFPAHLDMLRHTLEVANILGAENLRMFSFFMPEEQTDSHADEVIDRLGQFLTLADAAGIALCHENEKGIYGSTAEHCLHIHQVLPRIRGVFDPANFVQCGVDTRHAWQRLKPYIKYLHIKDSLPDGTVVPAGHGVGAVPEIVKDYLASGGCCMTIEPHLTVFSGLAALEQEGDTSIIGEYRYPSADAAFDAACNALKEILQED